MAALPLAYVVYANELALRFNHNEADEMGRIVKSNAIISNVNPAGSGTEFETALTDLPRLEESVKK